MINKKILVTGSLAYDHIMDFPGRFADHILPDKIHTLNVSFLVDNLKKQWGGTAGNIAYNLTLLNERSTILAAAGSDFAPYKARLRVSGVDVSCIKEYQEDLTSTFFVMTDRSDNQISGFYLGVMKQAFRLSIKETGLKFDLAIISPNDPQAMVNLAAECKKLKLSYIFDPGQQIPRLEPKDILNCIEGATVVIGNDYEIEMICRKTKKNISWLLGRVGVLIITKGDQGSEIITKDKRFFIPPVKTKKPVDPTGAGDAYRAGLIKGILNRCSWDISGRLGSLCAVYAVEKYGTQEHSYTPKEFMIRYERNFGKFPAIVL